MFVPRAFRFFFCFFLFNKRSMECQRNFKNLLSSSADLLIKKKGKKARACVGAHALAPFEPVTEPPYLDKHMKTRNRQQLNYTRARAHNALCAVLGTFPPMHARAQPTRRVSLKWSGGRETALTGRDSEAGGGGKRTRSAVVTLVRGQSHPSVAASIHKDRTKPPRSLLYQTAAAPHPRPPLPPPSSSPTLSSFMFSAGCAIK